MSKSAQDIYFFSILMKYDSLSSNQFNKLQKEKNYNLQLVSKNKFK